ncbi:MAG: DNA repair protein RecN [Pseudomonadota bacterium]
MLTNLQVRNFAIIDQVDLEIDAGMTVLTGETGAGKSILVDALGLVLGERGGGQLVRDGAERAEFSAEFQIGALPRVSRWLRDNALDQDDACLLRRVISAEGRSRAFINGNAVTVQQLKKLGEQLLDIHGQHFHQSLVRRNVQRDLLDFFGNLVDQREATEAAYEQWQVLHQKLIDLRDADADRDSRLDLLRFQLAELDTLAIGTDEFGTLQAERQTLLHSGRLAEGVQSALAALTDADSTNAAGLVADANRSLDPLLSIDSRLVEASELLYGASIQLDEAADALSRYGDTLEMDPARHDWVEERLDAISSVARKHRVEPDEIGAVHERLQNEFDELTHVEERSQQLDDAVRAARDNFQILAEALSVERRKAAKLMGKAVSDAMDGLGMPGGMFVVNVSPVAIEHAHPWGIDDIEFHVSANRGQAPAPLAKVASGGELSRISLAIQVIASNGSAIPTMVFDEVDSGVGGRVAEMVGRRLQELAQDRQVMCVTHLPQVAALADSHFRINKVTDGKITKTGLSVLSRDERVEEIARMLGGVEITQTTLDHAAEMLAGGARKSA